MRVAEKRLEDAIAAAHNAIEKQWEKDRADSEIVYAIDIPAQSLTVHSGHLAQEVLRTLKGIGIGGTYRIAKNDRTKKQ